VVRQGLKLVIGIDFHQRFLASVLRDRLLLGRRAASARRVFDNNFSNMSRFNRSFPALIKRC
jgi:hypothetical protein